MERTALRTGIDIGSTTAKIVVLDEDDKVLHKSYRRHNTDVQGTLLNLLNDLPAELASGGLAVKITGSAGLGISERYGIPFIQEVLALNRFAAGVTGVANVAEGIQTIIDIGGEDTKIVFLHPEGLPDMRMNGNCAGGTGAFID